MSVRRIKAGATDQSVVVRIVDATDGSPETGVVYNTSGIDLWYRREGAASVDITEASLAALTTAHTDGGFLHINDGWYRLDLPDAAVAAGAAGVQIGGTVTGMVVLAPYVELVAYDPYDAVRLGLTALPNAAADAAGGLPVSDAGSLDLDTLLGRLDAAITTRLAAGAVTVGTNNDKTGYNLAADQSAVTIGTVTTNTDMRGTDSAATAAAMTALRGTISTLDALLDKILAYHQLALRKDAGIATDRATELGEINADEGSGAGGFDNQVNSAEADSDAAFDPGAETVNVANLDEAALQQIVDDLEDGGRLDLLIDAIKAKTDSLTFTVAGQVDANVQSINDAALTGDGQVGTEWGPA